MNALAPGVDEGRGKLRKASVSRKQALTRRCPNGATPPSKIRRLPSEFIGRLERTQGSEPSQYLEEEKTTVISRVVASEMETA